MCLLLILVPSSYKIVYDTVWNYDYSIVILNYNTANIIIISENLGTRFNNFGCGKMWLSESGHTMLFLLQIWIIWSQNWQDDWIKKSFTLPWFVEQARGICVLSFINKGRVMKLKCQFVFSRKRCLNKNTNFFISIAVLNVFYKIAL